MARKNQQGAALSALRRSARALSREEIETRTGAAVPERTLRRWLSEWVADGVVERSGVGRATRYRYVGKAGIAERPPANAPAEALAEPPTTTPAESLGFLHGLDDDLGLELLAAIRDLWTHSSTALEGNTLTLGDTHFILQEGLTVSGKPLKDHEEVVGHARAIDLVYQALDAPLTEGFIFDLHTAVQTERVTDIYKPIGAWKVEPNGTHAVTAEGRQVFIEYAAPADVPVLMKEIGEVIDAVDLDRMSAENAHQIYAKVHIGVAHVHPFWDGNGRIARLLANIPLLRAGLPPLTIRADRRREYIQLLTNYDLDAGQLDSATGAWPESGDLAAFTAFCGDCYSAVRDLVAAAFEVQRLRA